MLSILSLLQNAKEHTEKFPSVALDSGTLERSTIHVLTRMLNSMSSSCEYSGTQAVSYALGLEANYVMHKKCYLFSDQAIRYVTDLRYQLDNPNMSNASYDSDTSANSSFSSGIYSLTNSEANSSSSDSENNQSPIDQPATKKTLPILSEEDEFGNSLLSAELDISDLDSDLEMTTNNRVEQLLQRSAARHGSIRLETTKDGKLCVATQAEDYHRRAKDFFDFSLYELTCTTYRREIARKKVDSSSSNSDSDDSDIDEHQRSQTSQPRRGRNRTTLFPFEAPHPLKESHALALLRKFSVAHFIKRVPPYPGARPTPLTDAWKNRARAFAQFALVCFRPWQDPDGLPGSTTWKDFCKWMAELRHERTIVARTRAAFVLNTAHNLKSSSSVSRILKRFRGSAATRWLDMEAHLRPKRWIFGDEVIKEPDLKSRTSQQEAELAMRELLHKVCDASPAETKKNQMLLHTIKAYRDAIAPDLHENINIQSLFQDGVPNLLDRINCFTSDSIEKVHAYNLTKLHERTLQAKLKETKQKRPRNSDSARAPSPPPSRSNVDWSPQQLSIVNTVSTFLEAFVDWKNGNGSQPLPLSMLIFGGPGVGKTTVLKELSTMCKLAGMPLVSSAATGVAAGAMLDAGTNHSKYCLPVYANNEPDPDDFLPPLSKRVINILMTEYEQSLAAGTPLAIAID